MTSATHGARAGPEGPARAAEKPETGRKAPDGRSGEAPPGAPCDLATAHDRAS